MKLKIVIMCIEFSNSKLDILDFVIEKVIKIYRMDTRIVSFLLYRWRYGLWKPDRMITHNTGQINLFNLILCVK